MEFRITRQDWCYGWDFDLRIFDKEQQAYATSIVMTTIDANRAIKIDPVCVLHKEEAINLMDALWNLGIRPSSGAGDANTLEATKYHLEDLRKLVFKGDKK
jgi:hypothetical protein